MPDRTVRAHRPVRFPDLRPTVPEAELLPLPPAINGLAALPVVLGDAARSAPGTGASGSRG
ncbi:hypothetical protein ACIQZB_28625 [Streptomyces sp. NPDC097727]|uniref:hypothetical protein n=1 Tax=Streptomyces sp. NPDC097727 TaxID=3366092 RepID=UPI0038161531